MGVYAARRHYMCREGRAVGSATEGLNQEEALGFMLCLTSVALRKLTGTWMLHIKSKTSTNFAGDETWLSCVPGGSTTMFGPLPHIPGGRQAASQQCSDGFC